MVGVWSQCVRGRTGFAIAFTSNENLLRWVYYIGEQLLGRYCCFLINQKLCGRRCEGMVVSCWVESVVNQPITCVESPSTTVQPLWVMLDR